jgi:hypothetical protein
LRIATDPPGGGFAHTANQISTPLGVTFYGLVDHGGPEITPDFNTLPLFNGVTTIHGDDSESYLMIQNPAEVAATYEGDNIIAILNDGKGKVVFDNTIDRFMNGNVLVVDTPQYVRNSADWLLSGPELKIVFLFGTIANLDATGNYVSFDAVNLRWLQFFPFGFIPYSLGERIIIAQQHLGVLNTKFIFGLFKAVV